MAAGKLRLLLSSILLFLTRVFAELRNPHEGHGMRSVIDVEGSPGSVVWVVQLSDLHFSVFHQERALDFSRFVGPSLAMINPSLVLITGDLTDGKSKDLLTTNQDEKEWVEYQTVMADVVKRSGLDKKIFYDLRGNHDSFGVIERGGAYDFYNKYSLNAGLERKGNVHSITLQNRERKHLFVGFDSTIEIGLRGPTNLFGHPTDQLLTDIDLELSQWDSEFTESPPVTKISFGHFPLSFSAASESGKNLRSIFLQHSLSAYLCGHLHTRFGKNLKRHHHSNHHFLSSEVYYQLNIHQRNLASSVGGGNCSDKSLTTKEFWEWEMGDWRKSRTMRILAIDMGHVSFLDIDFQSGSKKTIILPTFPLDSQLMQRISSQNDYRCQPTKVSSYKTIRALVFSGTGITSVSVKIYDSKPGKLNMVLESYMEKDEGNGSRGDLYFATWNWRAFTDSSPDRYWLQIEAVDILGRSTFSELRPFSVNGLTAKVDWKWSEFLVMGCHWASLYHLLLCSALILLYALLLIPQAFLMCSESHYSYKNFTSTFNKWNFWKILVNGSFWILTELSRLKLIWSGILVYLMYLTFCPWFLGYSFTEKSHVGYMTHRGWVVEVPNRSSKHSYVGFPEVMVVVLPHLYFVVFPAILLVAAFAAEKEAHRMHYLLLSGKKHDDYYDESRRNVSFSCSCGILQFCCRRWKRKLLLLVCMAILWVHWKQCRAVVKAYEMNPFLHSPIFCGTVPLVLAITFFKTATV